MNTMDIEYMEMALELAARGRGSVSPNPMVGAVIVACGRVIGCGWHKAYGGPHAEVEAVESVILSDQANISGATIYVNLEPCSHWGKTPPCADMIIERGFARVVVGCVDTNPEVAGRGIARMRDAGIEVEVGVLEQQSRELNVRFFTVHRLSRPYVILKWAQTSDGFLDAIRPQDTPPVWMTGPQARALVHTWRAQEDAVVVGTTTAQLDNPSLTVREVQGRNPLRVTLDRRLRLPVTLNIFNDQTSTILFTDHDLLAQAEVKFSGHSHVEVLGIDFSDTAALSVVRQVLWALSCRRVSSVFVEGGAALLNSFISENVWDEARVFTSKLLLRDLYLDLQSSVSIGEIVGVKAPKLRLPCVERDMYCLYTNSHAL